MAEAAAGLPVLRALIRTLLAVVLALTASAASAHKASDAYLTLDVNGRVVTGQWDIALRDLDFVLLLDADGDGAIRWGEVERRRGAILSYAVAHLMLDADGHACTLVVRDLLIDRTATVRMPYCCSPAVARPFRGGSAWSTASSPTSIRLIVGSRTCAPERPMQL